MTHVYALGGLGIAAVLLLAWTYARAQRARRHALSALGWTLPEPFDWRDARIAARAFGVEVELRLERFRVLARAAPGGGRATLTRRERDTWAPSGLRPAETGDAAFDEAWHLCTEEGASPAWLTPALRRALAAMREPISLSVDDAGIRVEHARTRDPAALEMLVRIAAAVSASPERARDVDAPPARRRELARLALVAELAALPALLVASYFALRPSDTASVALGPAGEEREARVAVQAGDVLELWQDATFEAERYPRPSLRLEVVASGAADARVECSPYRVNGCSVHRALGGALREGRDCFLEDCEPLRAERDGELRIRARISGDDPGRPYASGVVLRLKRRSRLLP